MNKIKLISLLAIIPCWATNVAADQVILDDTIVDGSMCVGFDCVNGEVFSFDSIRLKENNVRIHFEDTSTSSAFPTNDWRIVINDTNNGGQDHFSIEDITGTAIPFTILAGAPNHGLYLSAMGIGHGTNDPQRAIHVAIADTPTVRFEQTPDLGWTEYVWDVGGNESNYFVRDSTAGTLPFSIRPGADDDTLVVLTGGDVSVAGTLSQGSSRAIKRGIVAVNPQDILARVDDLEISRWRYRSDLSGSEHIGPMAEDFHRSFGLGRDDKHIAPQDLAGVAVASTKALRQLVKAQAAEITRLRRASADTEKRLARIEAILDVR